MNTSFDNSEDIPAGLRMALTKNLKALNRFASLSTSQQLAFVQGAHQVSSGEEMQEYVDTLLQLNQN